MEEKLKVLQRSLYQTQSIFDRFSETNDKLLKEDLRKNSTILSENTTVVEFELQNNYEIPHILQQKMKSTIENSKSLRYSIDKIFQEEIARQKHLENRNELLSRSKKEGISKDEIEIEMEILQKTKTSLDSSHHLADNILNTGYGVLETLVEQRKRLTNMRSNIYDIGNTLGVSNQVLRTIERRIQQDKILVYSSMALISIALILLIFYF